MKDFLKTVKIAGEPFDLVSDTHCVTEGPRCKAPRRVVHDLVDRIASAQKSKNIILAGDLFHAEHSQCAGIGIDVSPVINQFLGQMRHIYDHVLYSPGNHCLRRTTRNDDPWRDLDEFKNVHMPRGVNPVDMKIGNCRVLMCTLFYDGEFISDHPIHGEAFAKLVDSTVDGRHLLQGSKSIPLYRRMTETAASALTEQINLVVTHVPIHPSSSQWRVNGDEDRHLIPKGFEGKILHDPADDKRIADYCGKTPVDIRRRLNAKTAMGGSNVFDESLGARPRNGLTVAFGHHHRDEDREIFIKGSKVRFVSHQRMEWD